MKKQIVILCALSVMYEVFAKRDYYSYENYINSKDSEIENKESHKSGDNDLAKNNDESVIQRLKKLIIPKKFQLQEFIIGNPEATNTLIIYSSFTCKHCGEFHKKEFPKLLQYIMINKNIKICLRNYLNDIGALESASLLQCCSENKEEKRANYDRLYAMQAAWLKSKTPREFLKEEFKSFGYDDDQIDKCIENKSIYAGLVKWQQDADEHKIINIPAFVLNNVLIHQGKISVDAIIEIIDAQLGASN